MVVTIVGLLIVAVSAIYVAWPLLTGSGDADPVAEFSEASALEKEKDSALEAIREIDFDLRVGKISEEDHVGLRADLEKRALAAMTALDSSTAEPALRAVAGQGEKRNSEAAAGFCPGCGQQFKRDARFCIGCGKKLPKSGGDHSRRRANS